MSLVDDRIKNAMIAFWREVFGRVRYLGQYEYVVASCDGKKLSAKAADTTLNMPDVVDVVMRPSIDGGMATLAAGSSVTLFFLDGDPTRARINGGDPAMIPTKVVLDASAELDLGDSAAAVKIGAGVLGAARMTDPVIAGPFSGIITMGSTKTKVG